MIWGSQYRVFDTPGGRPLYVNAMPSSWVIIDPSPAALERALEQVGRTRPENHKIPPGWARTVNGVPRSGSPTDVKRWIHLCRDRYNVVRSWNTTAAWVLLLAALRLERVLLWPACQVFLPYPGYPNLGLATANRRLRNETALTAFEQGRLRGATHSQRAVAQSLLLS